MTCQDLALKRGSFVCNVLVCYCRSHLNFHCLLSDSGLGKANSHLFISQLELVRLREDD